MKQTPVKLGPLALLLTVISICLTTLAILTFTTARADRRLAEKYAETVHTRYELELRGQAFLQELAGLESADYGLMGWEADADGVYWTTLEQNGSRLRIGWQSRGREGYTVVAWRQERVWAEDTAIGHLWLGN